MEIKEMENFSLGKPVFPVKKWEKFDLNN